MPQDAKIRVYAAGAHIKTPNTIEITDRILWLLGFYMAEGCSHYTKGKNYFLCLSSDRYLLKKAKKILEEEFGVHAVEQKYGKNRAPALFIHSKILQLLFKETFRVTKARGGLRVPTWVFQLPLGRLKHFLEGFREGNGTHSGKKMGSELCFDTKYERFAIDLAMLLLRFGIVASIGEYKTKFKKRYGDKKFKFYRLTVCEVSTFDIRRWDRGVKQKTIARRRGDILWAKVKQIKRCKTSRYVYDFSVPGAENFIAGSGICCHNTYGPRMRLDDGRVVPNFVGQALRGEPLTVYGDGKQTRSFCYVTDLIEGIYKLLMSNENLPVNLGNPQELSILELANRIIAVTGSKSKIVYKPLPIDDPKNRRPDITRAKKLLGWAPKVGLEEGLRKTVEYVDKQSRF